MTVYVTLDDNNGMMFNNRRQSQDRVVREYILNESKDARLWMNEYTARQFGQPLQGNIVVDNDFLGKVADNDYCFVENLSMTDYISKIKKLIIFKWNRVYPADMYFDIPLNNWQMAGVEEFVGSSHELITKEEWVNEK